MFKKTVNSESIERQDTSRSFISEFSINIKIKFKDISSSCSSIDTKGKIL